MTSPILLLDRYLVPSLRQSLKDTLDKEKGQAVGLPIVYTKTYADYLSSDLLTPIRNEKGTYKTTEIAGFEWIRQFVRYDEELQYPTWRGAATLYETMNTKNTALMCWFFQDKLVIERIDRQSNTLLIAADGENLSGHERLALQQNLLAFEQSWTPTPRLLESFSPCLHFFPSDC